MALVFSLAVGFSSPAIFLGRHFPPEVSPQDIACHGEVGDGTDYELGRAGPQSDVPQP
ncbi:hypothetical protein FRC0263_00589 [Corynebacterium diphtheriae]|nr:hypothetical protein FRC0263_00589 [Corynebacterium diphtheriae]